MKLSLVSLLGVTAATVLFLLAGCGGEDLHVREYQPSDAYLELRSALDTCTVASSAVMLAREFMEKYPDDVAAQVLASSVRYDMTSADLINYYHARADSEPDNSTALYLAGRITYSPEDGRHYADAILSEEPNSYWGHLLKGRAISWQDSLSDPDFSHADAELRQAIALDNSLPYAVESLGYLYAVHGDTSRADEVYRKLCQMEPTDFERVRLRMDLAHNDDQSLLLIDDFLDRNPNDFRALAQRAYILYTKRAWPDYRRTVRRAAAVKQDSTLAYDMACSFALQNKLDSAFAWLHTAVEWGYADMDMAGQDSDLANARVDPRWDDVRREMAERRRLQIAALSAREVAEARWQREHWADLGLPEQAPDFKLKDLNGERVSLSELRGKVVVLDFWATWCYWCQRSSPLIQEFADQADSGKVAVYGVDVMERDMMPQALSAFRAQTGINFPSLIGTPELTEAYKVIGLPSLFVIDPQGRFAYRAYGYSPGLGETLKEITAGLLRGQSPARHPVS